MKLGAKKDPNLKLPIKTVDELKKINNKLVPNGFDNIKVLNSIAVEEFSQFTKSLSKNELLAWVISKTYDLQQKGIVRDNARSIGKEKKKGKRDDK
tara:strand:- start:9 stop:296 length:288 start_codon:yes stop_codon:yes gene_type:complete